ncbi:hypothetical protein AVEN_151120-1 [Araneus ventricosus]|uniref:DNA helicase Pif1-like 2B domain-containing protein n=1 Tax=Araneus ventricosus TaxID=182803 RepID=A0A4Y2K7V2_ARAVE|nr:hypothetical protein AVEN_151120-1 [Araneus ventricosus]
MDSPIFKMGKCSEFCELIEENPHWELFVFYELKEIMRQKDEFEFIEALNALASGNMKEKQIELIKSRELSASAVPRSAIRLYSENKCVDVYNEDKIRNHPGPEYISIAKDVILGKLAESTKERVLEGLKRKKLNEMNGLPHWLTLKIGIKYMITNNIDVEDGLVNGACGILKLITFENNKSQAKNSLVGLFLGKCR